MGELSLEAAVSAFAVAPADLVAKRQLGRRRDSKFVLSVAEIAALLEPLSGGYQREPGVFRYRARYFDTPDLRCFDDYRRGRRPRHKVRLRHDLERRQSFFEIKTKRSKLVSETVREQRPFETSELSPADLDLVAATCRRPLDGLEPQLSVGFRRVALVGVDTEERVTIDSVIELERGEVRSSLGPVAVVQIEQRPYRYRTPVRDALRAAGFRRVSAGKYCLASVLLRPELTVKRMAPALRLIEERR